MEPMPSRFVKAKNFNHLIINNPENNLKPFPVKLKADLNSINQTNYKYSSIYRHDVINYSKFPNFFNGRSIYSFPHTKWESPKPKTQKNVSNQNVLVPSKGNQSNYLNQYLDTQIFTLKKRIENIESNVQKSSWKSQYVPNTLLSDGLVNYQNQHVKQFAQQSWNPKANTTKQKEHLQLNLPMNAMSALQKYRLQLSLLEQEEILNYSDIWFLGLNAKKNKGIKGTSPNNGYDDENGSYIKACHDHIAYQYEVLETLGKGSFGQVFKGVDHRTGQHVAIKIIRNRKRFHKQSLVEIKVLYHLKEKEKKSRTSFHVIHLLNHFVFRNHPCLIFELLGDNLYNILKQKNFQGFNIIFIQKIAHSIFSCLSYLRKENIIHCDLKPENVLLINNDSPEIKVIDFGSSCFQHEKIYSYIQSRYYRSPEIILGIPYTTQIDVWSLGCMLPELLTGKPIFPGESEIDQLSCIMEVVGLPPKSVLEQSMRKQLFFDIHGVPRNVINSKGRERIPNSQTIQSTMNSIIDSNFLDLINKCLEWDSEVRLKPDKALRHPWFTDLNKNEISPLKIENVEGNIRLNRLKHRVVLKEKENIFQSDELYQDYTEKECLPALNKENKTILENIQKENSQFPDDALSVKTEFPTLYQ